jgi:hypothetical protein
MTLVSANAPACVDKTPIVDMMTPTRNFFMIVSRCLGPKRLRLETSISSSMKYLALWRVGRKVANALVENALEVGLRHRVHHGAVIHLHLVNFNHSAAHLEHMRLVRHNRRGQSGSREEGGAEDQADKLHFHLGSPWGRAKSLFPAHQAQLTVAEM